jgi:hypothetical protein
MGSLYDEVQSHANKKRPNQLDAVIETLKGDDLNDFISLLNDESVSAMLLSRVLDKRGIRLNRHVIYDYRKSSFRYTTGETK